MARKGILPASALILLSIYTLSWYSHFGLPSLATIRHQSNSTEVEVKESILGPVVQAEESTPSRPKITIIAIWRPPSVPPSYLPYFFQSVQANPQVNLLLVNVVKADGDCDRTHSNATNIKEICLTTRKYLALHVDFLCKRWQCSDPDRALVLDKITKEHEYDYVHSTFRILRSGIFGQWIDPQTTIWGWCDLDTYLGNFERAFPWDIAPDFDIIAFKSQPDPRSQQLLFTRGHMAFFRHSPEVLDKLHSYPTYTSLGHFLLSDRLREDCEESQFSNYMFLKNHNFTFLHIEGMIDFAYTIVLSVDGAFYFNLPKDEITHEVRQSVLSVVRSHRAAVNPTFSEYGVEEPSEAKTSGYSGWLWFPADLAVYVETGWNEHQRSEKAYFMRRTPGGPVTQRREPRGRYLQITDGFVADEALYKHFQEEKRTDWFKRLPRHAWNPAHTYIQWDGKEGEIWDAEGNVVFETGRDEKLPDRRNHNIQRHRTTTTFVKHSR
ncbi:hypothetical protein BD410DRAFT_783940 [Rickenella mellea]|uniref:Uncharacterized protein n=1 Tax=Rickenella mellea TaxID=50990 RepID=A0A4Y7QFA6_9AGAM|nr:hypothetical protein BD410DRAFT_783940 [Rickenella mellea]